jgi:hypothetical protein
MGETQRDVPWNHAALERHRHVCVFYHSRDEEYRVLRHFIEEGFRQRDKGFHIIDARRRQDHLRRLGEFGIDVLRSHPVAVIGGIVQENPYFVPPDELLREVREHPRQLAGTA